MGCLPSREPPKGKAGTLLLDPEDLAIVPGGQTSSTAVGPPGTFTGNFDSSILTITDLQNALLNGNVIVQTGFGTGVVGQSNAQPGNLDVQTSFSWANSNSLTLKAFDKITIDNNVTITNTGGGSLTLLADSSGIGGVSGRGLTEAGFGQVNFNGTGAQINLGGATPGNVNIIYDGFSNGAFNAPLSFAGKVSGGTVTVFQLVNDLTQLQAINGAIGINPRNFALGTDIDASSTATTPFTPLNSAAGGLGFRGVFDGEGHSINNLTISDNGSNVGLFGEIGSNSTVRNLTLSNLSISGTASSENSVGGVAGLNLGLISNVTVTGAVHETGSSLAVGGVVGENLGAIMNSTAMVDVTVASGSDLGGFVGVNSRGTISSSSARRTVTVTSGSDIGGFAGINTGNGTITSSFATATVNAATGSVRVGGFAGQNGALNGPGGTISNSHSTGEVIANGDAQIGGLVGFEATGTISNAYATGEVIANGGSQIGGLVGSNSVGTISNAYATGAVLANNGSRVGGLAGVDFGAISNAYSTGEVVANGGSNVGGLVGFNLGGGGNITSSFWDVQTSGQGGSAGGSGLTTQQAQDPNTLLGLGFNPNNNIWGIVPFGSYPFLLSQFPTPPQVISGTVGSTGVTALAITPSPSSTPWARSIRRRSP
jgi:hypothetical protein